MGDLCISPDSPALELAAGFTAYERSLVEALACALVSEVRRQRDGLSRCPRPAVLDAARSLGGVDLIAGPLMVGRCAATT